ncbi:MAG: DUF393 domain-containing protein [Granulosicoccus sp.]|nr:DUF393 domain-containing protein [Granulosicoccus sp.]
MYLVRRVFSLDLRSIALFRILLALLLLTDLLLRSVDMSTFYTDAGVLPRLQWLELTHGWHWSIHAASGELWWQALLFLMAGIAATALLFGYRSKLAALASFILLTSLMNRNGLLLQGGDNLLVVMSFWALFLPLGARWSFDSALQPVLADNPNALPSTANREQPYFSVATIAIVFQVLYLYVFTAMMKTGDAWVTRFDAAYYAVSLQHFATPVGDWIRQFPGLLKLATVYVLSVEFVAPFLVLCPFMWPWVRVSGLLLLASLHAAFLLMLHIGLFPLIDFMALSLLIPGAVWIRVRSSERQLALQRRLQSIVMYFDEDCGFCLKMCLILRAFLLPQRVQIIPAQNHPDIHAVMERENSWVIRDAEGKLYTHWHAMAFLFSQRWPFKPLGWLMSHPPLIGMGNGIYRWVASNRGLMGSLTSQVLPYRVLRVRPSLAGSVLAGVCFYVVTAFNVYELPGYRGQMPQHVNHLARALRLDQRWDMFAPFPLTNSSYLLIPGTLRSGEQVDLYTLTSSKPAWQAPERFYPLYDSYRWRKYLGRVDGHSNNAVRLALGSYLCRQWNEQPRARETQLATLEIFVVKLQTNTQGAPKVESRRRIWRHWCYAEFADP